MNNKVNNTNTKVKRGDTVRILLGKDRGKQGKIMAVLTKKGRVMVEGINMVKKHVKARTTNQKGQRIDVAAPVNISNVQLVCPGCKKSTRVGITRDGETRQRVCKKCESVID